ncbi:MAG: heparan-alpha-glucosaminide N-acetyltransferase domain-containing protein [Candidatus Hodarchaeota archaeon]
MERIKALDTIRGACIYIMVFGHMVDWWIRPEDYWFRFWCYTFVESLIVGFLFISGVSAALSFKNNELKLQVQKNFNMKIVRNVYLIRALLIVLIGFAYNIFVAFIWGGDITDLWSWLVLQTIGVSLLLAWPFLRTSRNFRIFFGILILIVNQLILSFLMGGPYKDLSNIYGIIYHILYNPISQFPILAYFSIILIGTALGDKIFELNVISNQNERKLLFKNELIKPLCLIGAALLIFGIIFFFPELLILPEVYFSNPNILMNTISAFAYSMGIILMALSLFMAIQIFELIKTKKSYRYLSFFSYYSFTIYLGHNVLYFLFTNQLSFATIWFGVIGGSIIFGFLFRFMYIRLGRKASLKTAIGGLSFILASKLNKNKN